MSSSATAAMTSDAKKAANPNAIVRHKMRGKHKLLLIIFSLVMMAVLRTGFMFIIIGMMPSVVAYYMDVTKHRYTFKSIFACNLSGLMPYIGQMLHHGPSSSLLQEIMGSLSTWLIIYGSAMMGWLLIQICPMVAQIMIVGFHKTQIARIERLQKKIESEWGPEVTQFQQKNDEY